MADKNNGNGSVATAEAEIKADTLTKVMHQPESKVEGTQGLGDGAAEETLKQILEIINESSSVITGIITDTTNNCIATIEAAQKQAEQDIELAATKSINELERVTHETTKKSNTLLQAKLAGLKLTRDSLLAKVNPTNSSNGNGKH